MKKLRVFLAVLTFVMALSFAVGALAYPSDSSKCTGGNGRHHYEEIEYTPPTCTQAGTHLWECAFCKKTVTETEPALGHTWGEWKDTAAATCTAAGTQTRTCRRCKMTDTKTVPALGHDWGAWKVTAAATCTDAGTETRSCRRCKMTETKTVPALGHDWGPYVPDVPPTCTDPGWDNKTCKRDPSHLWYQEVPALGHDWGEWMRIKDPSPLGLGLEERVCGRCGLTEQKEIPYDGEPADPGLLLTVTLTDPAKTIFAPDDLLTFEMTITNTGNVPLERPTILICRDAGLSDVINDGIKNEDVSFAPSESLTYTWTYTLLDSDAPLMEIFWSASAWVSGTYESAGGDDGFVQGNTVKMEFPVEKDLHPALTLTYLGGSAAGLKKGDYVPYDVEVKNTGDVPVTLHGYGVVPYPDDGDPEPEDFTNWIPYYMQVLAPDESITVTHRTKISSTDADNGKIVRTAVAFGAYEDNAGYTQNISSNQIDPEILLDAPPTDPPVDPRRSSRRSSRQNGADAAPVRDPRRSFGALVHGPRRGYARRHL